jgi:hypothetical protein
MERKAGMASFEMAYDADEDVLEVTFAVYDERFSNTLTLNDNILLFTDPGLSTVWGITLYEYSRLLGVSETEFTNLRDLPDNQIEAILSLLSAPPASLFFDVTDPEGLIARVSAPGLQALIEEA